MKTIRQPITTTSPKGTSGYNRAIPEALVAPAQNLPYLCTKITAEIDAALEVTVFLLSFCFDIRSLLRSRISKD